MTESPHDITSDLFRRLRLRSINGVILLCEVGDGAGFRNRGWSDAVSMQTWPSKKLFLTGYEVKATRKDWLRELDKPEKNERWQTQCHEWYIVAPKDIVRLEELPTGWGLMIPRGDDGLRIAARSDRNGAGEKTIALDLLAAVFRSADNERRRLEKIARDEIREEERQRLEKQMERTEKDGRNYRDSYEELAEALGSRWEDLKVLKKRAEAVRLMRDEHDDPAKSVRDLRLRHERVATRLGEIEKSIEEEEVAGAAGAGNEGIGQQESAGAGK